MSAVIVLGDNRFPTKIALTEEEQRRGLMWAEWPPPVMTFPYNGPGLRKFWMKNTVSPLDIVFCRNNRVIGIYKGEPMSTSLIGPDSLSDMVVELPAGTARKLGITIGSEASLYTSHLL